MWLLGQVLIVIVGLYALGVVVNICHAILAAWGDYLFERKVKRVARDRLLRS